MLVNTEHIDSLKKQVFNFKKKNYTVKKIFIGNVFGASIYKLDSIKFVSEIGSLSWIRNKIKQDFAGQFNNYI